MDLKFIIGIIIGILLVVVIYYLILYISKKFSTKESRLRFCPKCGGQDIISISSKSLALLGGGSPEYYCRDCELKSVLFPIAKDEAELKKIQKKLKKK